MQLDHVVDALPQRFGGQELGDGRLLHREATTHVLTDVVVDGQAHGRGLGLDVRELEFGVLEVPDGLVERLAVLHVLDGLLQQAFELGGAVQGDHQALLRQLFHQVHEALVLFTEQVAHRHTDIVEEQLGGVGGMLADLVQLAPAAEPFTVALDHDQAAALGPGTRVGLAHDHHHVAGQAVADEGLAAVDHPLVTVAHGGGADRLEVGTGARLGHRDGQYGFAGADFRQPFLLLLFGAQTHDVGRDDVRMHAQAPARNPGAVQLFDQHRRVPEITTATAIFGGHGEAQQVMAASLEPGFPVDLPGLVPLRLFGQALTLEETPRGVAQHFVVFTVDGTVDMHRDLQWVARQGLRLVRGTTVLAGGGREATRIG
ncbi:hypothetical protein D3C81_457980 [compost metagenome]